MNRNENWMAYLRDMLARDAGGAAMQPMDDGQHDELLSAREAEINRRELRAQAMEQLTAEQIPVELADLLDYSDAEHFAASMEVLKKSFKQAVQKGVEARVAAVAPKVNAGSRGVSSLKQAISTYYRI